MTDLRVLLAAPHLSGEATGEGFVAFKCAEALSRRVKLTVATLESPRHTPLAQQLPDAEIVSWPLPDRYGAMTPLRFMLKPDYPLFYRRVRAFMRGNAGRFDLAHQYLPMAMRYPTPLRGHGIPYVVGPLGGGLPTPPGFAAATTERWFARLRGLDGYRRRYDPWLRATYVDGAMVLGVAPYIRDLLGDLPIRRYENFLELGIDELAPPRQAAPEGPLRLLHVGRGVRTKGLREVVRALALLPSRRITLTSAGGGEEIKHCRREAEALGVADRVTFLGRVSRAEVEELYARSDVFVFPSFREPTGGVLFEAMRWGLPIVAARYGGPECIVDDSCGMLVDVDDPDTTTRQVAAAIERLAACATLRAKLGEGARAKVAGELWPAKADHLVGLYRQAVAGGAIAA